MTEAKPDTRSILLVEGDILVRHPLAEYLRGCGFVVLEAASGDEAMRMLRAPEVRIDVVIADMKTEGSGFGLRQSIRAHAPSIEVLLAGSIEKTVAGAADICEEGPAVGKPYEHHLVLDHIRRSLARRDRRVSAGAAAASHNEPSLK